MNDLTRKEEVSKSIEATTEVRVTINNDVRHTFNDPSDAWDYLIGVKGLPRNIAIKSQPDKGWEWNDLPFRFAWDGVIFDLEVVKRDNS